VGINQKDKSKMIFSHGITKYVGVSIRECSQPKGIKTKTRRHKLRSGVYGQGALKQKGTKQVGHKTRTTCTSYILDDNCRLWLTFSAKGLTGFCNHGK
jgi:hypothetical protein